MRTPAACLIIVLGCLTAWPRVAEAQRLQIHANLAAGSGMSLGTGAQSTSVLRSATYLTVGVMASNSEQPWLRYGVSLRSELEGKLTIGLIPQIAIVATWNSLEYGILGGIPIIFAPRSLYGLEAGGHIGYRVFDWLMPYAVLGISVYPLGNDVPEDSVVVMLHAHIGAQLQF